MNSNVNHVNDVRPVLQVVVIALFAVSQPINRKKYKNGPASKFAFGDIL